MFEIMVDYPNLDPASNKFVSRKYSNSVLNLISAYEFIIYICRIYNFYELSYVKTANCT